MKLTPTMLFLSAAFAVFGFSRSAVGAEKHPVNACGCYSLNNTCYCEKGAKCGCPGNCEPKGCEEARQKQLEKEIAEEMKRVKEAEKAQNAPKQEAQAVEEDGEESEAPKQGAATAKTGKSQPAPKMTAAQKKQLLKLIDVYLTDHPDAKQKPLTEIRSDL